MRTASLSLPPRGSYAIGGVAAGRRRERVYLFLGLGRRFRMSGDATLGRVVRGRRGKESWKSSNFRVLDGMRAAAAKEEANMRRWLRRKAIAIAIKQLKVKGDKNEHSNG